MIRYYNSRELSILLQCNLARWKRWSREFLPPDPLGGLQSGYARQYSMRESFMVTLGGHLVGFLKFSIHQAKIILADLDPWLENSGYYQWQPKRNASTASQEQSRQGDCIYIRALDEKNPNSDQFCYAVGIIPHGGMQAEDRLSPLETAGEMVFINTPDQIQRRFADSAFIVLLCIGQFRRYFLERIQPPRSLVKTN